MNQDLVISIKHGDKLLATGYFHDGGYTTRTFEIVKDVVESSLAYDYFEEDYAPATTHELIHDAIQLLEYAEAGVHPDDVALASTVMHGRFLINDSPDRGIMSLSANRMSADLKAAHSQAIVDVYNRTISVNAFNTVDEYDYLTAQGHTRAELNALPKIAKTDNMTLNEFYDLDSLVRDIMANNQNSFSIFPDTIIASLIQ